MPFGNPPFDPSDFGCGPVGDCVARQGGFDLSARIAPCNKTYACFLRNTIHLLALLAALTLSAREQTDTLKVLSGIQGADVTVYNLYRENRAADRAKAMEYAELFLSSADTTAAVPLLAAVCDELADWYEYDRSLFSRAIRWRSRSLAIYESLGDRHNEALAQYRLSREYTSLGQYHRALQYVSSAMNYFERTHDTDNLIECYNILGVVYFTCRQYDRAYEWFTRYTDGARMAGDTSRMVLGLNNSAVLAYTLRDTLKARTLIRESGFLSSAVRDTSKLCKVYLNNVSLYLMSGDLQAAASTLETVKPLLRKPDETGLYYQDEGLLLMAAGRLDEAAAALGKAISAFGTGEYGSKIQHCYGILQRIYAMKGEYRNAYQALIRYYEADIANRPRRDLPRLLQGAEGAGDEPRAGEDVPEAEPGDLPLLDRCAVSGLHPDPALRQIQAEESRDSASGGGDCQSERADRTPQVARLLDRADDRGAVAQADGTECRGEGPDYAQEDFGHLP